MPWPCFMIAPTGLAQQWLRRYTFGTESKCANGNDGHAAAVPIGEVPDDDLVSGDVWPHDDPRWPTKCDECDYVFTESDYWTCSSWTIYEGGGWRGCLINNVDRPIGAMYDAPWLHDTWRGPDGKCLLVTLPDLMEWVIDGPSSNGDGWTRTGTPPLITCSPSILSHPSMNRKGYHGFLQNGVLTDDLEGRTYP